MPRPPRVIRLEDLEHVPGPHTLTWLPVRATLGVRAFGCNAYVADEPGRDVVEPHTESPELAHEELYFVARGRATFTIDGNDHDAAAGTYVFVPDPASHRHAVAAEAGTVVLSFGGPPAFTPSAWEWSFRAHGLRDESPERAEAILAEGLDEHPGDAGLLYELACLQSRAGRADEALESLGAAVAAHPEMREWAAEDEDFRPVRADPRFQALLDPGP